MDGSVKPVWHIFDAQSRELVIPVYQRNYDWGLSECARLFDDLEEIIANDRDSHFFGAVVVDTKEGFTWVVIDGQQRLTTVSILMLALVHAAREEDVLLDDPTLPAKLESDFLLRGSSSGGGVTIKLKPVKDDADAYRRLFDADVDNHATSSVSANYRFFRERIRGTSLTADQLWKAISRLDVMVLSLGKDDEPQRIFETLNSTGKALSESDKIRNLVLMGLTSAEQENLYETRWNPMEKAVEYRTDWFIRWYLVAKTNRTPNVAQVYEAFKAYLAGHQDVRAVLADMLEHAELARQITRTGTGDATVDRALARYRAMHSDVLLPFLMPVLRDWRSGKVETNDLVRVLTVLESYLVRRAICNVWANALNKIFELMYQELTRLRTNQQAYADVLIYLLRRRDGTSGRFPDDEEFRTEIETRNIYRMHSSTRAFIFDRLENLDSKDTRDVLAALQDGAISIEHIMPQTLTSAWREELGENAEEIHAAWVHRLGNLTVTGYNSEYSNAPFMLKRTMKGGFDGSPYRLNASVKDQSTWTEEQIKERNEKLAEDALFAWPAIETDFAPPSVPLPVETLGTEASLRGRDIVAFDLNGDTRTVSSWAQALPQILAILARDHRTQLVHLAEEEGDLTVDLSQAAASGSWKLVDPPLSVWAGNSTMSKIWLLRRVFEALDLEPETLAFTLRPEPKSAAPLTDDEAAESDPEPMPFDELTKFVERFEELEGTASQADDTSDLRAEFRRSAAPFAVENPSGALGGRRFVEFTREASSDLSRDAALALITQMLQAEALFDPGAFHAAIIDGRMTVWLRAIGERPSR
ncbi:DUF262 domain-containing protein [Brachybacterium huguangmaarense]